MRSVTSSTVERKDVAARDEERREERRRAVRAAVSELDAPYRLVVTLRYLDGWDASEIATRVGVAHGTVRSWLARGRWLLKTDPWTLQRVVKVLDETIRTRKVPPVPPLPWFMEIGKDKK